MPEEHEYTRRSRDTVKGVKIPSAVTEHGLIYFIGFLLMLAAFGALWFSDTRYWLRSEEKIQSYQSKLMSFDEEIKAERRQIRIWENYNTATPTSAMVPARMANIEDATTIITDLEIEKQTEILKWESEK